MFSSSSERKACPTHPQSIHTGTGETEVEDEWVSRGEREVERGRESDLLLKSREFGLGECGRVNERLMDGWREHITQTADAMMQIELFLLVIKRMKCQEARLFFPHRLSVAPV